MPRRRALPYRYDGGSLSLDVIGVDLDGRDKLNATREGREQIHLQEEESWDSATITVEVGIHDDALELLPDEERGNPPWDVVLVGRCKDAKWRRRLSLDPQDGSGAWTGGFPMNRNDVVGTVSLQAYLVRTEDRSAKDDAYAHRKNTRLSSSVEWSVYFDDPQQPGGSGLNFWWESFEETDWLPESEKNAYYVSFMDSPPAVYLNDDIDGFRKILHHRAHNTVDAAVRNVFEDSLGQTIWLSLAVDTILSKRDLDMEERFPEGWKENIFERFQSDLFGRGIESPADDIRDPETLESVLQELVVVINEKLNVRKNVEKIIQKAVDIS